jgi:uncharacterized membrane protein
MTRLVPLDALRGLIMIVMALDHANAFVARRHSPGEFWAGAIPQYASALDFLVRLVTHLCAPGFFLLMAVGMTLFATSRRAAGWSYGRLLRHFATRGALLVVINLFLENLAWLVGSSAIAATIRGDEAPLVPMLAPGGGTTPFIVVGVLSALGCGMTIGAMLLPLGSTTLAVMGIAALLVTHGLIPPPESGNVLYGPLARLLLIAGHTNWLLVVYPVVPWLALLVPGLLFGRVLARQPRAAYRAALLLAGALLMAFFFVRAFGGAGNLRPPAGPSWIAFLNVTKYPPGFDFIALTLGFDLALLFLFSLLGDAAWLRPLLVFGRTPLFFYLAHLYLFASMGLLLGPEGLGIPRMLPLWMLGVLLLYPACARYDRFKRATAPDSFWRML